MKPRPNLATKGKPMFRFIHKLLVSRSARVVGRENSRQYRQRVRDKCNEMRREMGKPPIKWGRL